MPHLSRRVNRALLLLAVLLLPAHHLHAQTATSATILGTAVDESGEPLQGLRVKVEHEGTGATLQTLTDVSGRYRVVNLPAGGPYTMTVQGVGVRELTRTGIRLQAGQVLRLDLEVSAEAIVIEGVEVRASGRQQIIDPSRTGSATYVDAEAIEAVPTLSRNVLELTAISPLARESEGFSIAGQNERFNAVRLDGANIQDVFGLSATGTAGGQSGAKPVPLSAVEQFQILVSPFEVRHSGFTGGLMNAVTRSGTNTWRGELFSQWRDKRLVGDFAFDGERVRPAHFLRQLHGGWLGGPLVRDRLHLFVAAEIEARRHPTGGISYGEGDPRVVGISPDSIARLVPLLQNHYGSEPGVLEQYPLENPLLNVFGRLDWQPAAGQRLSLKINISGAEEDISPLRQRNAEYGFSSTGYRYHARTRAATLQWNVDLAAGVGNELLVHLQNSRERNTPASDHPLVQLDLWSNFEGSNYFRRVEFGANLEAQASRLNQEILQVTNQTTFGLGAHEFAVGLGFERFGIRHIIAPGALGVYRFSSLSELERNSPTLFQRRLVDNRPSEELPQMVLNQLSAYLQDEWAPFPGLRFQAGIRLDLPILQDRPEENEHLRALFGVGTTDMRTSFPMFSPRLGFNWQNDARLRTQVRGGIGMFAGRPPLSWLAQAYTQTGLQGGWLICPRASSAPRFDPRAPLPSQCAGNQQTGMVRSQAVLLDRDLRFPQDVRASLGIDQELPGAMIGSLEVVYTRAHNQIQVQDLNIGGRLADPLDPVSYPPHLGRRHYYGPATGDGFRPDPVSTEYEQVLLLTNRPHNQSFTLTSELQREVGRDVMLRGAYSYTRSFDTQSLTSADLAQSFARTATGWDPNDPGLRPSHYDQPHKVVLSASTSTDHRLGRSRVAVVYTGQSGTPYSYVYANDVNGDGYPGTGSALGMRNDLIYVPAFPGDVPLGGSHLAMMHRLIEMEPCLRAHRGQILQRNACRTPFAHRLDLRTSHGIRLPGGLAGELTADLVNALNLMNPEWGRVHRAPYAVPVLEHSGRTGPNLFPQPTDPLEPFWYVGPLRIDDEGKLGPAPAYHPIFPESQWQVQLGVNVRI